MSKKFKIIILFMIMMIIINFTVSFAQFSLSQTWSTYENEEYGIIIIYPYDWEMMYPDDSIIGFVEPETGYAFVSVYVRPVYGMDLDEYINNYRDYYNSMDIYPYDESYITINSQEGYEWYLELCNFNRICYLEREVFFVYNNKAYTIKCFAISNYYNDYVEVFNGIVESFEIASMTPTSVKNIKPNIYISAVPKITFEGSSLFFDASNSFDPDGRIINYLWKFGDGETGFGSNTSHTYISSGIYIVSLIVIDDKGATNTSSITITVKPVEPTLTLTPTPTLIHSTLTPTSIPTTTASPGGEGATPTPRKPDDNIDTNVIVALISALATIIAAYLGYRAAKKNK